MANACHGHVCVWGGRDTHAYLSFSIIISSSSASRFPSSAYEEVMESEAKLYSSAMFRCLSSVGAVLDNQRQAKFSDLFPAGVLF